jgi:hypothetical protein
MSIRNLPERDQPLSEQFRIVAKRWVDLDAAANLLEETKSAVLAQKMAALGDMPVSRAEMTVKASPEWSEHITTIVHARKEANLAKLQLEYIRMKHMEWTSANANLRHEARLGR